MRIGGANGRFARQLIHLLAIHALDQTGSEPYYDQVRQFGYRRPVRGERTWEMSLLASPEAQTGISGTFRYEVWAWQREII